MKLNSIKHP